MSWLKSKHSSQGFNVGLSVHQFLTGVVLAVSLTAAWATGDVSFAATDIADLAPGADRWRYDYEIQGPLGVDTGLNFIFGSQSYTDLSLTYVDSTLSGVTTDPLPAISVDGLLTVTALGDGAGGHVSIEFTWLGTGAPGAQPYELFDAQFNVTSTGMTSSVPEPAAMLFWLAAMPVLAWTGRRGRLQPATNTHCAAMPA